MKKEKTLKVRVLAQIIYYIFRLLNYSYKYEFIGLENKKKAQDFHPKKSFVYALWHQNLIGAIFAHIGEQFTMVISESKDGELVAVTCEKLGHIPARGSSTRGGKKALIEIVKTIKNGTPGALTVDGPKGPAGIVKPGVIEIAKLAQCAILPLSAYAQNYWTLKKSWDQFRIPKPFTRIIIVIGEPVFIESEASRDNFNEIAHSIGEMINQGEEKARDHLALNS